MNEEAVRALNKAKIALMGRKDSVFITTVLLSLKQVWDNTIPTAATDGKSILLNEDFFMSLTKEERVFLLAHEAWHVCFKHMLRRGERDHKVYNMAGDFVINLMLVQNQMAMPKGGLLDRQYDNMSTEEVYDLLIQDEDKTEQPFDCDIQEPDDGSGSDDGNDGSSSADLDDQITDIMVKAKIQHDSRGKPGSIPGDIEAALNDILKPKLPWNVVLQNYMNAYAADDYSFRRPNRRYLPDFILPSMWSEGIGHIAWAIDTSGSVSNEQFTQLRSEMVHVQEQLKPSGMTVVSFDTRVQNVYELSKDDTAQDLTFTGRGGTNLHPVFNYFGERKPQVLIVLSDLECHPIQQDPGYDVIWVRMAGMGHTPSFGRLIEIDV